jgi:superfamily II DNA or RNA helicase
VRMVSEGVDVPRLAVGVYATATATPLFFAQAVGRFVRARTRGETASVFVPSVPHLLLYASELERERDHALRPAGEPNEEEEFEAAQRTESEADLPEGQFTALGSEADFDRVVFDGGEFGLTAQAGSAEEQDYLGLPGLLDSDQVKDLLRRHQAVHQSRTPDPQVRSTHEDLRNLRKELNGLVAAWHHRTGQAHGKTHAALRKECGGPPAAIANADQLTARIDRLRSWAAERRSG